jgi:hypothetical protein
MCKLCHPSTQYGRNLTIILERSMNDQPRLGLHYVNGQRIRRVTIVHAVPTIDGREIDLRWTQLIG